MNVHAFLAQHNDGRLQLLYSISARTARRTGLERDALAIGRPRLVIITERTLQVYVW